MIRKYQKEDKANLLHILLLNTPEYFDPSEAEGFNHYLDQEIEDYFVIEENGQIIGSGGINYFPDNHEATLSWDIIHPDFQGKGYGKSLTLYRLDILKNEPSIKNIVVRTSQKTDQFYEKLGFQLQQIHHDHWAKGYHLYEMKFMN